jgi:signal transduction histidine kinase
MVSADLLAPSETSPAHDVVRLYEQRRRLGFARRLAPPFAALVSLFVIALTVFLFRGGISASQIGPSVLTDIVLVFCGILFAVCSVAAQREQVTLATITLVVGVNLAAVSFDVFWAFLLRSGMDPIILVTFASLVVPIVLTGILGEPWMILVTTLFINSFTLFLVGFTPPTHPPLAPSGDFQLLVVRERSLFTALALLQQWAVATLMLTTSQAFRQNLTDLGRAYAEVQQLDELKDQFITNVNHELRTPTMAVQGYVKLLRLRYPTLSEERRAELLAKAARSCDSLVALLSSILDVQRLDPGAATLTPEAVPLEEVLHDAILLIDPREGNMVERALRVDIPAGLAVWAERVRMRQILSNLLSNAVKYSAPGTPVEVTARFVDEAPLRPAHRLLWGIGRETSPRQRWVEFTVRDYGFGIPPNQIPLLFKRFVRLPRDLASNIVGNGLGLHLCRTLAEAMGGHIWVESVGVDGEGSTFHLRLPPVPAGDAIHREGTVEATT